MHAARWIRLVGITVLVLAFYFVCPVDSDPAGGPVLRAFLAVLLLAALATAVVAQIMLSLEDEDRHLDGLILAILAVWVVFALAFYILASHQADQVAGLSTKLDSLYFAATTMLTIGYGDVHATGQLARGMVLVQMLFDVVFVAMGVSVLNAQVRNRVERGQGRPTQRNPR